METDVSTALATLQLDPENAQALSALKGLRPGNGSGMDPTVLARALADARRWHRERGDFELCVQLIDLELAWTTDRARRADLLHEKGRLYADELLREDAAQASLREALDNVPEHTASQDALTQMSLVQGNWQPIAQRYLQQAESAPDKQLASSLYGSVAEMYLKYMPEAKEGEQYLRKSMDLDPRNRRSSMHLERLLRGSGRADQLLALYSGRAAVAGSRPERALAEVAAAEVSQKLGKTEEALAHFKKALEANPSEGKALRPVVAALTEKKEWAELAKVLEGAARSKRAEADVMLLTQLATVLWKKLSQVPQAEIHFRKVRKLDPANKAMVEFYREYHGKRDELPQLLTVLAAAQKGEPDPERRIALGIEMAKAAESRPQNAEKVIDIWKGLLRLRPHLPEAVQALQRLYTRTQKWNALLELLKEDFDSLADDAVDAKVARQLEIVTIYRDRLNLEVMVVNSYQAVLQLQPNHPEALAALAARFEAQGRWSDLIQNLGKQADAAGDPAERLRIHRRIATLWADKLGKHQNAVSSLEKILEVDPTDADARGRLRNLYSRSRSWKALIELTRREAPILSPEERRARLGEAAKVAAERLGDIKEAINLWNQVLAVDERDADALAGLVALYDRERRWAALAEILERQRLSAAEAKDTATEVALLMRRGTLLSEKLGAGEAAVAAFQRVQDVQPQHTLATRALREIYAQSGDFAALEQLYAGQGNYEDLCDTLTALADRSSDPAARTRLLERVAVLASERLRQPERALKAYERILAADPRNREAATALVPLYRAAQKWPRLLETFEILLGKGAEPGAPLPGDPASRLAILKDGRQIAEQRLGSKGLAFKWAARCFEADPTDSAAQIDLERLAGEADEWNMVAGLYARRLEVATNTVERQALLKRSLRIALVKLHKPAEARRLAELLLAEAPGDDETQNALEQILTQSQAWPDLAALLHARAKRVADPSDRAKVLFRAAQIEEEKAQDLAAASRTLAEIVDLEPANERAANALTRVLEVRQDWPALVAALGREAAARPADEQEDILLRIGEIQERRLGDLEATFATYRHVLEQNPLSAAAVAGLERVADLAEAHRLEIARLTLPFYQRTDNAPRQAAALEVLAGAADTAEEKASRLERLVAIYAGPLKDPRGAYRASLAIFDLDPSNRSNRELLARYAADVGMVPDLSDKLRAVAGRQDTDPALRRDLLVDVAELNETRLADPTAAEKVYREILEIEPLHPGGFRALSRLYRDGERWKELRDLLEARQVQVSEPTERIDLVAQVAEIDETVLDDTDHAIASYEKMLELDPADPRAYRALDRHYTARERWRDREQLLERRLHFAAEGEVYELEFRRAEIRFSKFGDVDGAIELLESIVKGQPSHEGARRLLEKALTLPEHRRRAAHILEPLYESGQAWQKLATVLEIQRDGLPPREAAAILARIAEIQEMRLDAREAALATWRAALAADPGHPAALREVERLAEALERWNELVDVYQELAFRRDGEDIAGRAELLSRAARLYAGRLGNRRAAIDAWKMVLNLDPENAATAKPAADALEGLYAETGNTAALVKILRMQVDWAEEVAERVPILFRIAELEEKALGDTTSAVATLRSIVELDPASSEAVDGLERIFEATGQGRAHVDILRRRIDQAPDLAARQVVRRRIAEILQRQVGDLDEAIAANLAILDESPDDPGALDSLAALYEQQKRHTDRLELLERRLSVSRRDGASRQDLAARVEVLRRIADLLGGPLESPGDALVRWREILAIAPADPGALVALERMLGDDVDPALRLQAAQALEPVYESAGRFAELAAVLKIYVEAEDDSRDRVGHLVRLAALQETRLGDAQAAFASYGQAVQDALGEPQLGALLDAYERLGGPGRVAEVIALYREISPDVMDETVKLRLDRSVAEGARRVGDRTLAAEYYRRILDRLPNDGGALAALEALYREADDAPALYEILARQADQSLDPGSERRVRAQLGALAEQRLDRPDDAIAAWERVFELSPEDREATQALDRLYMARERWTDLVQLLERVLERRAPEAEVLAVRFRLAEILARRIGDLDRAVDQLRAVLRADPDHDGAIAMLEIMLDDATVRGEAAELLEPVYAGRQDWASLVKIGEIRLTQVEDSAQRLALTKRIARLYEEQLEDYDSALRWYGKVFQENPSERLSLDQLLRLAGKLDRWQDVALLLSDYLGGALDDSPAVLEVVRRAAEVFDLRLGNRVEARRCYRRLYDARPDDPEMALLYEVALERWEAWRELRELLDERASRAGELDQKKELLRRSARIDEEMMNDADRAVRTLREIIDLDPEDQASPTAADELERLLRAHGRFSDLADHLEAMLTRAPDTAERDAVSMRLAEVLERKLDRPSSAVDRYAEVLERSPAHKEAIAALERLLSTPDQRHRVARVLEPVFRRAGNWARLEAALEAQLEGVEDREDRVRILREVAEIQQRLAHVDSAFETRARAWLVDVSDPGTLADMEALALQAKLYGPLVQTLQRGAEEAGDPDLGARLWAASARVLENELKDPGQAIEAWRHAVTARSDDVEAFLALERLLAAGNRLPELAEVLESHLEVTSDADERKNLAKRIARLYDQALKLRDPAVNAWRAVLEIDDADLDALDALGRLYVGGLAWRDLAGILQRKIELTSDPQNLRLLRLTSARLYDERLEESQEAVSALRAVLDASPGDVESLEFLDRIFSREGQNPELLEVLDQRVAVEADPVQRDALAVRAARLLEDELSDVDGAIGRYREVLERTPAHPEARAALSQIARGDDYRMPAIAALEPLLRAGAEWDQLVELLELKLAVEEGLGPRLEILSEIARIEELARRDPKKAFAAWARALAEDPSDAEPREALERLAAVGASWARLAEVYVERLEGTYDSGLQRTLAVRLGELHEGPLSDAERALDFYRKALDAGGDEAPVLMALERVLRQLGRDAELAEVLARRAEVVSDPAAEAELLVQLGQVRLGRLDDVDGALSAFRDALERAPDHVGARAALRDLLRLPAARDSALDVLEPLAESRGDWSELVSLYEHRLETRDDKLERANWLRRIAELYDERLGQPALALDALGRALTEEPTPGETVDALERLASGDPGRAAGAARLIEAALDAADPTSAHELALRAARLYETSPASRGAAERLYTRVLEDDPENVDALASLETFHRGSGERAGLATVLERRATLDLDPTVRRGRLAEAARLREALGDVTAALADWQLLREAEEGDAEVLGEMARLFEGQGKLDELAEVLAERARFESDGAVRAALLGRIGDLKMGPLEDLEGAADAFREALDVAPDDPRLLGALEQIEERREDWSTLQEVLLRRMGAVGDGPAQIPVLFRLAKNADERLSDIDQAVGFLHQVLAIEEANGMAFLELERILRANERWYDLVDVLGKHADNEAAAGHKPTELALRVAIADVWEKQLDSADSAAEALEKVLEVSPQHVGALLSLARIHEAAERWEQATEALEGAAAATSGGMDAAEIHYRTAQIKKAQGAESQELEPIYVRALQADRRHALSLKALEEIARAASDSQRLAQLLELRLDATTAPLERKPLLAEIATLQRTTFGNPAGAVPYLEQLAALAPDDAAVSEDLAEALTAAGRSDDAARILERLVEQLTKARRGKEVAKHLQRLGGIAEAKGDRLGALERYTAAYKLDPGHAGTLAALGRLALTQKDLEGARRYYRSLLLQNFDEKTAGITKAGVYLALGRIHLDAGEDAKARNMFERGLEADPKSEDLKTALAAVPR